MNLLHKKRKKHLVREHSRQFSVKNDSGFTLIEIVIVIVIIGIISGIAAVVIMEGVKGYSDEQSRSDLHYQARLAVERIAREARHIQSCAAIIGAANPSAALNFTDINGNAANFNVVGTDLNRGANLLASGITSAQPFRFLTRDGITETTSCVSPNEIWFVEIDVTSTRGAESLRIRNRVHPRNF